MSALEVLALDPATPQIRAPGAGDTYKLPRAAEVPQGTNAAPAVAFTGDTDTGLYSPGANEIGLATGGTGRLTIDGSGNVNIPGTLGVTGTITGSVSGTASNVTGTVAVANGGTGNTTYTDGQLLIGNSTGNTLTKATLTAGSGVTITNGTGSITISATSLGGDVVGPASATDEALARFDGTTGKLIQNSNATLTDAGALTLASSLTLSAGTANGVLYLDGSKVATSGSALTFDGTNFATTGTSSAAKLIPTGGTASGNGIYLPAANSIGITTSSTNAIRINSSQQTGFGNTAPAYRVHATQTSDGAATTVACLENGGTLASTEARMLFVQGGNTTRGAYVGGVNESASGQPTSMVFGTSAAFATPTERMRLDSSGNLGIGTTSPTQLVQARKDQAAYTWMRVENNSSNASAYAGLAIGAFGNSWGWTVGSTAANSNALNLVVDAGGSNSSIATFSTSGNVGIGTTSPSTRLNVVGGISRFQGSGNAGRIEVFDSDNSNQSRILINPAYNSLEPAIQVTTNTPLLFATSNTERARITATGDVGIGTTSPGSKLDVKGTLRLSGLTSGYVGLSPAAAAGSTTYTLPTADGTSGQFLRTNGTGTLSWASASAGGGAQDFIVQSYGIV